MATTRYIGRNALVFLTSAIVVVGLGLAPAATAVPSCAGAVPTIFGTPDDDELLGTDGDDVIVGLGGDDSIYGLEGDDLICGGEGDDEIYGEAGYDELLGDDGEDYCDYTDDEGYAEPGEIYTDCEETYEA